MHWARTYAWIAGVGLVAFSLVSLLPCGRQCLHHLDAMVLGERAMDTLARLRTSEDWAKAEALTPDQDYGWLRAGGSPVRIAHALGESGSNTANTLAAARRAYSAGFRRLEVDLVYEQGELRCQHDPGPQGTLVKDGCTLDTLMAAVPPDTWLVLDIKNDFAELGQRVVDRAMATGNVHRIVFQLYRPEDFALFNRWQALTRTASRSMASALPGPILTAYLSHRRIDHVAAHLARLGVKAFTLPLDRLTALSDKPAGAAVLVHPVHDCAAVAQALRRAVGIYTLTSLHCDGLTSPESR